MAENQKLKAQKEEDSEREEIAGGEKSVSETKSSVPESAGLDGSPAVAEFGELRFHAETLVEASCCPSSGNDRDSSSHSLCKAVDDGVNSSAANSLQVVSDEGEDVKPSIPAPSASLSSGFKGQFGMSHQELLASVTAQAADSQAQMEGQTGYPPSSSDLLPASLNQSISSPINPTPPQPKVLALPQDSDDYISEVDRQNSFDQKMKPSNVTVKAPSADGYNWRKYGQKLVKSNESSRSYYRCTQTNCHAKKKVEHCDHSGSVLAITYKGRHNHEPPRKIRCTKARRSISSTGLMSSACPGERSGTLDHVVKQLNDSDSSASRKEPIDTKLEKQLQSSSRCDHNTSVKAEKEHDDEPNAKKRRKEGDVVYSAPLFKAIKEPKIVVQAAGDVGISGDGYRWRKYGQKMVKGNPNPRSYYKCTSAGCPVRKHVERAIDGTTTIIITYEGKHDHDMPVPKKRHGPPSAGLLIAAATAMNSAQLKKSEAVANQKTTTQWSMDVEGGESASEKASELGGDKALESARTLLSIGIELRPY